MSVFRLSLVPTIFTLRCIMSDDISEFQALCMTCIMNKRDANDTHFRGIEIAITTVRLVVSSVT